MSRADAIADMFPDEDIVQMDGFDDCIIGYTELPGQAPRICYSVDKILAELAQDMEFDDALEHFDFNIAGSLGPVILVYPIHGESE